MGGGAISGRRDELHEKIPARGVTKIRAPKAARKKFFSFFCEKKGKNKKKVLPFFGIKLRKPSIVVIFAELYNTIDDSTFLVEQSQISLL